MVLHPQNIVRKTATAQLFCEVGGSVLRRIYLNKKLAQKYWRVFFIFIYFGFQQKLSEYRDILYLRENKW